MALPDDERPTVNRSGAWFAFVILFVLGVGGIFLGLAMQDQNKTTGSRNYDLTPEQYEENTRWARERAAEQPAPPPMKTKEAVREKLLSTLRTVPGVISIRQDGLTLWVGVSLDALGNPPTERAQEIADYIAKTYKGSVGQGICVRVYYGDERQLARSCTY